MGRGILFLSVMLAGAYFVVLKMGEADKYGLDKSKNQVDRVEERVNKIVTDRQKNLEDKIKLP